MQEVEVAVVGAGVIGAATAWQLTSRGLRVALFEQYELGHRRGSSHGESRIFRLVYDEPDYVRLGQQALPLWRQAERELGTTLLFTTGGLEIGPAEDIDLVAASLETAGAVY